MKLNLYNKGNGWYVPIGNYKDKEEKPLFMNVRFAQNYCPELSYLPDSNGNCKKTIYVNEGSFNKYIDAKGNLRITFTIFNYDTIVNTNNNVKIDKDELPFF